MTRSLCVALALLVGVGMPAAAQEAEQPRQVEIKEMSGVPPLLDVQGFSDDYRVGPGDLLEIQVVGQEELRQTLRVSNSGEISVPMLGLIRVLDQSTFEIEDAIAGRLKDEGLVKQPEVLVSVQEQAKPVYVMGAVTTPGEFIMTQAMTVVDAILMAGGLRFNAADEALLHRRGSTSGPAASPAALAANPTAPRPGIEVVKIDLTGLKDGKFNEAAVPLRRGDVLVVPDLVLEQFFVVGEVLTPRNYVYTPGKVLMASQAMAWAGGPTPTAKMSEGMLGRFDEQGNRDERKVDWGAILRASRTTFRSCRTTSSSSPAAR